MLTADVGFETDNSLYHLTNDLYLMHSLIGTYRLNIISLPNRVTAYKDINSYSLGTLSLVRKKITCKSSIFTMSALKVRLEGLD